MSVISYSEEIRLKTSYFDSFDNITPQGVLDIFQDIAGIHANILNIGFKDLYEMGYYWILKRVKYDIINSPKPLSKVVVKTYPYKMDRAFAIREYEIRDLDGNLLITGISLWVIIDINTRSIKRMTSISYGVGDYVEFHHYDAFSKLSLPDISKFSEIYTYKVLKSDLDHNKHMNNINYAKIIFESTDIKIKGLTIEYIKEVLKDDLIYLYKYNNFYIGLNNNEIIFSASIKE